MRLAGPKPSDAARVERRRLHDEKTRVSGRLNAVKSEADRAQEEYVSSIC